MQLVRLAQLMSLKYSIAEGIDNVEASLRGKINSLWMVPNKTYTILKVCAEADVSKAATPEERLARAGNKFCEALLIIIDYLKKYSVDVSLDDIKYDTLYLIKLIEDGKNFKDRKSVV